MISLLQDLRRRYAGRMFPFAGRHDSKAHLGNMCFTILQTSSLSYKISRSTPAFRDACASCWDGPFLSCLHDFAHALRKGSASQPQWGQARNAGEWGGFDGSDIAKLKETSAGVSICSSTLLWPRLFEVGVESPSLSRCLSRFRSRILPQPPRDGSRASRCRLGTTVKFWRVGPEAGGFDGNKRLTQHWHLRRAAKRPRYLRIATRLSQPQRGLDLQSEQRVTHINFRKPLGRPWESCCAGNLHLHILQPLAFAVRAYCASLPCTARLNAALAHLGGAGALNLPGAGLLPSFGRSHVSFRRRTCLERPPDNICSTIRTCSFAPDVRRFVSRALQGRTPGVILLAHNGIRGVPAATSLRPSPVKSRPGHSKPTVQFTISSPVSHPSPVERPFQSQGPSLNSRASRPDPQAGIWLGCAAQVMHTDCTRLAS